MPDDYFIRANEKKAFIRLGKSGSRRRAELLLVQLKFSRGVTNMACEATNEDGSGWKLPQSPRLHKCSWYLVRIWDEICFKVECC